MKKLVAPMTRKELDDAHERLDRANVPLRFRRLDGSVKIVDRLSFVDRLIRWWLR